MTTASDLYDAIQVLLVEDGPGDVRLLDDVDAVAFQKSGASHANDTRPDLISLEMDGRDVLANIKADAHHEFGILVKSINEFWPKRVKLPKLPQHAKGEEVI